MEGLVNGWMDGLLGWLLNYGRILPFAVLARGSSVIKIMDVTPPLSRSTVDEYDDDDLVD